MSRSERRRGSTLRWSLGSAALVCVGLMSWRLTRAARDARANATGDVCGGDFDWPASQATQLALRLRFVAIDTGAGLDNLRVRACGAASRCETALAEATTRAGGFAALTIDNTALATKTATSPQAFEGFLMVEGGARHQAQRFLRSTPLRHQQCEVLRLSSDATNRAIQTSLSAPVVETRAIVEVQVARDNAQLASDTQLEVWNVSGAEYRYCADCRILYSGRDYAPSPGLRQLSGAQATAWLVLAPRDALLVARDVRTQQVVSAVGPVTLMPEPLHVSLAPASAAQLSSLPESIRRGHQIREP